MHIRRTFPQRIKEGAAKKRRTGRDHDGAGGDRVGQMGQHHRLFGACLVAESDVTGRHLVVFRRVGVAVRAGTAPAKLLGGGDPLVGDVEVGVLLVPPAPDPTTTTSAVSPTGSSGNSVMSDDSPLGGRG
ncbi:hypothetical protein [Actinoplanes sp. ATCC 53533]|uniref:hypothetical protein n=1 Tax=Actinoplanes sp. ATCC 53533 TaxID=1288362 RepID=UPI000F783F6D|nr:hypothetical protein [Actinoplanes sp. ATCC 53533]